MLHIHEWVIGAADMQQCKLCKQWRCERRDGFGIRCHQIERTEGLCQKHYAEPRPYSLWVQHTDGEEFVDDFKMLPEDAGQLNRALANKKYSEAISNYIFVPAAERLVSTNLVIEKVENWLTETESNL